MKTDYREEIVLNETVNLDGVVIVQLTATLRSPSDYSYNPIIVNQKLYMENNQEIKNYMTEFEEKIQNKLSQMEGIIL